MKRFGDFEEIKDKVKTKENYEKKIEDSDKHYDCPLKERIVSHLANTDVIVKSQQRGDPDITLDEKKNILNSILDKNPGQFLYRFKNNLKQEHLQYFSQFNDDAEVNYYLSEAQKLLNPHTSWKIIKNRRYAALQRLRRSGDYFSEEQMKQRQPLMYDQLITPYLDPSERVSSDNLINSDIDDVKFSTLLFNQIDSKAEKLLKKQQEDAEDEMFEEEDEESDTEDQNRLPDVDTEMSEINQEEKLLLRDEFMSFMFNHFLEGKDEDFDYSSVDYCEEYDLIDIQNRDTEEMYFDSEEAAEVL